MATVHIGRLIGPAGFARTVAIKRLHPHLARDPEFVAMFMDEARVAARIRHPNVASIIDVVAARGELLLVMEYIEGESLSRLIEAERQLGARIEPAIVVKVMTDMLHGLHAAHEVRSESGRALDVVHRDVSPQNILVGADGVAHLIDFGVAKAAGRIQTTREGQLKGKIAYMAPEQVTAGRVDSRTDTYAAAAVLWEALTGERLFVGEDASLLYSVLTARVRPPSDVVPDLPPGFDDVVLKGIAWEPGDRYTTALEMADALEAVAKPASAREVARWVRKTASEALNVRSEMVSEVESVSRGPSSPALSAVTAALVTKDRPAEPELSGPPGPSRRSYAPPEQGGAEVQISPSSSNALQRRGWPIWAAVGVVVAGAATAGLVATAAEPVPLVPAGVDSVAPFHSLAASRFATVARPTVDSSPASPPASTSGQEDSRSVVGTPARSAPIRAPSAPARQPSTVDDDIDEQRLKRYGW
jgi:serine/threonine-protein kinase